MHCPSCGQQQISNDTKFCSRCGMPLSVVSEVVAHGGYLPQLAALESQKTLLTRANGAKFSILWCLFFLLIMAPLWGVLRVSPLAGASAIIGIFGGLLILASSLMFLKRAPTAAEKMLSGNMMAGLPHPAERGSLPPQQTFPVSSYAPPQTGSWRDTADLEPRSVTEATTRLLEKDEQQDLR